MGSFLGYMFNAVITALGVCLNVVTEMFNWWRYAIIIPAFSFIGGAVWWMNTLVTVADQKIGLLIRTLDVSPLTTSIMTIIADVFPFATLGLCIGIYVGCMVTWITYKTVKSWIPTVSGT